LNPDSASLSVAELGKADYHGIQSIPCSPLLGSSLLPVAKGYGDPRTLSSQRVPFAEVARRTPCASRIRKAKTGAPHPFPRRSSPSSPPHDYKSHPALRSRTLRQSKMADTAATAGAGSSGTRAGSKQSTNPADNYHLARRRTLQVVVSSLLTEAGFESAEKASVETLTEMLQSYISEIGRSAKSYCEHTARTQPTLSDIVVTLVEMGFNVDTLPAYAKRSQRMVITAPPVTNQPVTPKALTAGQNRPHPPHIPSHFPEFPDPHTYIKTPTYREPVSDYQVLREKAASQRRDVERALTRFMAKTGETQSLFKDDVSTFPLIAARPFTIPYLTALLPSELEMQQMEETDSSEQDEQTDTENLPLHISTVGPPLSCFAVLRELGHTAVSLSPCGLNVTYRRSLTICWGLA
ncbi:Transcription initiation factor TFIID subunit 8, partial [Galemys pyrenaicus]